jgi:asparagine synthase (glutamine-hydrolysing)
MCGIFGWLSPGRAVNRARVASATNRMRHRGPDDEGYLFCDTASRRIGLAGGDETTRALALPHWRDEANSVPRADVALGFRRLSIHDLSEAGHQPMGTADRKLWIVFNGEVYNFPELRAELEGQGQRFVSGTDTEVVLKAYETWGAACLGRFNGMWGMAILDLRGAEPSMFLARDRCGVKPLFYAEVPTGLVFASELKCILAAQGGWKVDDLAMTNYLAWGRLPSPRNGDTFVRGVKMLPPGCHATWRGGKLSIERYWDLPDNNASRSNRSTADAVAEMRSLLEDAVRLRLRADVPVGSCLSGGVDSSIIVGMVNSLLNSDAEIRSRIPAQHTFSSVYKMEGAFNEKRFIDRVLEEVPAQGHETVPTSERLVAEFDRLVWHQEEPFIGTSMFAQWCVMTLVQESGVKVLLDGQAADELFAGYRPYRYFLKDQFRQHGPLQAWRLAQTISGATGDQLKGALGGAIGLGCLPDFMGRWLTLQGYKRAVKGLAWNYLKPEFQTPLMECITDTSRRESYPWRRVTETMDDHLRGLVTDFGLPHLLRFEDRNSMAFGVEARVPFTDYRLVELAFRGDLQDLKIHEGWPKWILRKAGEGLVPEDILWRKDKMGFGTPEQDFVQALLKATTAEAQADWPIWQYVDQQKTERLFEAVQNGTVTGRGELMAFRIVVANTWLRHVAAHQP